MNKRSNLRGFGVYLILILAVIAIWYWLDGTSVTNGYTRQQFEEALESGTVAQIPCGTKQRGPDRKRATDL